MDRFMRHLAACGTTTDILDLLLAEAAVCGLGIKSVRYYRLRVHGGVESLESVDCGGHDEHVANIIRGGQLVKSRSRKDVPGWHAMFGVIDAPLDRPIVFQLSPSLDMAEKLVHPNPLPHYLVREDGFEPQLGEGRTRDAWADVPLVMAGRAWGKLSCSLALGRFPPGASVSPTTYGQLLRFQDLVAVTAPYLESLTAFDLNNPLEEASREIFRQTSYEDLYRYLTDKLRVMAPFAYAAADVLVVAPDTMKRFNTDNDLGVTFDSELLMLRASSYTKARDEGWINRRYYRKYEWIDHPRPWLVNCDLRPTEDHDDPAKEGRGQTPWVWREGRALRLNRIEDENEYRRKLSLYARAEELAWENKIPTDSKPRSLLIVPIFHPTQPRLPDGKPRVIGVIRFANKQGEGDIEPREELLLQRIADQCIGPKILSLKYELFTRQFMDNPSKLVLTRPDFTADDESIKVVDKQLVDAIKNFFPNEGRKIFLLCRVDPVSRKYFPHVIYANTPGDADRFNSWYDTSGSLTEFAIRFRDRLGHGTKDFVYVNDLAYASYKAAYVRVLADIRCALASAIRFRDEDFGAFVILSDRYDITPAAYGRLVQVIAQQLGWLIKRAEITDFAVAAVKGIQHDVPDLLNRLRNHLGDANYSREFADGVLDYASILVKAYALTAPPTVEEIKKSSAPLENIEGQVRLAGRIADFVHKTAPAKPPTRIQVVTRLSGTIWLQPNILTACLYNLIKNAVIQSIPDETVEVVTFLDPGDNLTIEVTNGCANPTPTPLLERSVGKRPRLPIKALYEHVPMEHSGVILTRTLARWHQPPTAVPGPPRRGDLEYQEHAPGRIRFRLRLPVTPPPWS